MPFCHAHLRGPRPPSRSYPQALATIGDHLRKRRLDLGLLQREVAERLGADPCSVTNWELNRTKPALRFLPGIVRFLGYAPWAADGSLGDRLLAYRRERVLSQAAFARLLGVDPGTLGRWERGLRVPTGRYAGLAEAYLDP
ncbi:MAG: helix-turn-helix domain-containing protein [Gemmatimonadales bacterium]